MECLIAWRTEMLGVFDVRGYQLTIPTVPKPPQGRGGDSRSAKLEGYVSVFD